MYMHVVYYVHECMYLIISYIQRCYVQGTVLVIPPYPYCIEEEKDDVPLEDCWYAARSFSLPATCVQRVGEPQGIKPTPTALMTAVTTWSSSAPLRS